MTPDEFKEIVSIHLAPILGAKVEGNLQPSTIREQRVALIDPSRIALKPTQEDLYRVIMFRSPGFSREERNIAEDFTEELLGIYQATDPDYMKELLTFLPTRAICRHLGGALAVKEVLLQFKKWASSTYEGGAITASIGIDPNAIGQDVTLSEIFPYDFSAVLTNGYDTLLVVTPDGHIAESGQLDNSGITLKETPYRLSSIAEWTSENRISIVLNRLGEQLVFRDKKLIFSKRRGKWSYFPHEKYIRQMQPPQNRILRESIYESCLDVSFARTGGCLGVVRSGSIDAVAEIISPNDRLDTVLTSPKSKTIKAMVGSPFQLLDRRLRQELLALDGATIISHEGEVLAVGAIISVPSGSDGGGRRAAAIKASELGLGIKISEDGEITTFKGGRVEFVA